MSEIIIEGSRENELPGEYVIDLTEYRKVGDNARIEYFQLKHSTTQVNEAFTLSTLKDTIIGFAERFKGLSEDNRFESVAYTIIANRKIAKNFKDNIAKLAHRESANERFTETIKYTLNYQMSSYEISVKVCNFLTLRGIMTHRNMKFIEN